MGTILCFPPAGAGPSFFHPWRSASAGRRIVPVELPGRERRFAEPAYTELETLVTGVVHELRSLVSEVRCLVAFGHSLGAVMAYEVVRAVRRLGLCRKVLLVVSGAAHPFARRPRRIAGLPDDDFVAGVQEIAGYRHPAMDDPEMRELLLPALRSDIALFEAYRPTPGELLDTPVLAIRGSDDHLVSSAAAAGWESVTSAGFGVREVAGGHMYLVDAWHEVLRIVEESLAMFETGSGHDDGATVDARI